MEMDGGSILQLTPIASPEQKRCSAICLFSQMCYNMPLVKRSPESRETLFSEGGNFPWSEGRRLILCHREQTERKLYNFQALPHTLLHCISLSYVINYVWTTMAIFLAFN